MEEVVERGRRTGRRSRRSGAGGGGEGGGAASRDGRGVEQEVEVVKQEGEVCLPAMSLQERRQLRRVRLHRRRGVALAEGRGGPRREDVVRQHAAEHL